MAIEMELAAPSLLIAVPQLGDPNFKKGVILIVDHGEDGTMGLLINRFVDINLGEFFASHNIRFHGDPSLQVCQGGPVEPERAFILHSSSHEGPETESVLGDVRLSYSLESLELLAESPPERLRFYLGYAGWGPGQLAEEVTSGAWLVTEPSEKLLFDTPMDDIWEYALHELGIDPIQLMFSGSIH